MYVYIYILLRKIVLNFGFWNQFPLNLLSLLFIILPFSKIPKPPSNAIICNSPLPVISVKASGRIGRYFRICRLPSIASLPSTSPPNPHAADTKPSRIYKDALQCYGATETVKPRYPAQRGLTMDPDTTPCQPVVGSRPVLLSQ